MWRLVSSCDAEQDGARPPQEPRRLPDVHTPGDALRRLVLSCGEEQTGGRCPHHARPRHAVRAHDVAQRPAGSFAEVLDDVLPPRVLRRSGDVHDGPWLRLAASLLGVPDVVPSPDSPWIFWVLILEQLLSLP